MTIRKIMFYHNGVMKLHRYIKQEQIPAKDDHVRIDHRRYRVLQVVHDYDSNHIYIHMDLVKE